MKKNFIIAGLLIAGLYNAQQDGSVGINTKTPSGATLDVQIDKSTGYDKTVGQGVAVPRVTKQDLFEMTKTIAEGALVYVNDIGATSGTGNADRVAEVTTANGVGFYYYQYTDKAGNGLWKKVGGGSSSSQTWEQIRTPSTGVFSQSTNQQVISSDAFFVIANQAQIRLPKMIDDSDPISIKPLPGSNGKMILIFKSGIGNTTVLDHNGTASGTSGAYIDGTSSITSNRGKQFIWDANTMKWYPIGY